MGELNSDRSKVLDVYKKQDPLKENILHRVVGTRIAVMVRIHFVVEFDFVVVDVTYKLS